MLAVALILAASGSVTLPLEELDKLKAPPVVPVPAPPVAAVLSAQRLSARSTPDGLEIEGIYSVSVLADSTWSKVCVLKLEPGTQIVELTTLEDATLAPIDSQLCLLSRKSGTYAFDVKLDVRGNRLAAGRDALWSTVDYEGEAVPQQNGVWTFARKRKVTAVAVERPPLDPSCPMARAELVSTVEGHAQLNVTYQLKLDREQPISFEAPEGWRVERVSVNGVPRKGAPLELTVTPARETDGTVELQLSKELGIFHLAGQLSFELPKASWPVTQLELGVHLPVVFGYRRTGGSVEPADAKADDSKLPGNLLPFRQHLITASAPTLELEYWVDVTGRYFAVSSGGE